jgi:hypothetical protein
MLVQAGWSGSNRGTHMSKKPALGFQKILAWLMTEVMFGRTHFIITRGLRRADRAAVLRTAPRFFDMTLGAHADSAQLAAARIFDRTGAASIHTLLSSALKEAGTFKHGTATEVHKLVDEAKVFVAALEPVVAAVRTRRNQTMAHVDARPIVDPNTYIKAGLVSYGEIEKLFEQTGAILNKFSLLYRGASVVLELEGAKDYERALDLIASAMRQESGQRPTS